MMSRTYIFTSAPSRTALQNRLASATGLYISIQDVTRELNSTDDAPTAQNPQSTELEEWEVCFQSPPDNYFETILCSRTPNQLSIFDSFKDLNKCPHFPFFATAAAVESLGGKAQPNAQKVASIDSLPDYSRLSFREWRVRNGGSKPPGWVRLLEGVVIASQTVAMFAALPFKVASGILKSWRSQNEYKRKVAQVERMSDRAHLSRHFKSHERRK